MSIEAAIAYLRRMRELQSITQSQVARIAGVESKQVYRWERGESEPTASSMAAFIQAVNAPATHVQELLSDPSATEIQGRTLAEATLDNRLLSSDEHAMRQRASEIIDRLILEPEQFEKLLDYGLHLVSKLYEHNKHNKG